MKTCWFGCSSYDYKANKNNAIFWEDDDIEVYYDIDGLALDGYDDTQTIFYCTFDISTSLFDILASKILNKPIVKKESQKLGLTSLSSFYWEKNNYISELIVDENNLIYFDITIEKEKEYDLYPIKIIEYLLAGLKDAGYKKAKVVLDEERGDTICKKLKGNMETR